jgi:general L-amino acid transport system permease protein
MIPTARSLAWLRANLFATPFDAAVTVALAALLWFALGGVIDFAITSASGLSASVEECRAGGGACWSFIAAKFWQLMVGRYPEGEQWRCAAAVALPLLGLAMTVRFHAAIGVTGAASIIVLSLAAAFALLDGTRLGLPPVPTERWGGLTLTLMIAITGAVAALPLGLILALARRSSWPVPRVLATIFIEFWRGVPLVTVLFMASIMLPLFLPAGVDLEKLTRALIAVSLFASAYTAEVIRGGLQSIPASQAEAAEALGFSYAQTLRHIIVPQALRNALPGLTGTFIGLLKDTTLVLVIGLFDFLGMVQAAIADPEWAAPGTALTGYVFAAAVFWMLCSAIARVGQTLETRFPQRRV